LVPLLPFMAELLQGNMWTGWVIRCIPWFRHYLRITDAVFQEDNAPIHTAGTVHSWFEEHEGELHLTWPVQSIDLNITEPLLSVLVTRVRNKFLLPTIIK
jgi:hypothetical protein